jgi:hypothetical protein
MKDEWKICIEESEQLLKIHGILCMVNKKGEKLFVKPISHKNGFIELMPLTLKELKELNITVQESCINYDFDIEVQESTEFSNDEVQRRFEEERRKKSQQIPLNSVSDAEKMKEIAEKAKEILARKGDNPEELKAENEDLRLKLEIIATKELDRRCQILGIPENSELRAKIRENPSILQGYEQRVKEEMLSGGSEGSAPLNKFQLGQNAQGFASMEDMIKDLRKKAKSFVPYEAEEAKRILDILWKKTVQGMVERRTWEIPFENANPKSKEGDSNVKAVEVNINAPQDPNEESETEKWTKKKRRTE